MKFTIKPTRPYSLNLTLSPSFVSSLYERQNGWWVRTYGKYATTFKAKQEGHRVIVEVHRACDELKHVIETELGLRQPPFERKVGELPRGVRRQVKLLAHMWRGVRISRAPWDWRLLLVAVVLSRRTRYDIWVRYWTRILWHSSPQLTIDPVQQLREAGLSISPQVKALAIVLSEAQAQLKDENVKGEELFELRRRLLSIRGIGPKLADAFLMAVRRDAAVFPCDTHALRVWRRLGLLSQNQQPPIKQYCLRYSCDECPAREVCARFQLQLVFGTLSPWVQTITYLHGSRVCRSKPRCASCLLRSKCRWAEMRGERSASDAKSQKSRVSET